MDFKQLLLFAVRELAPKRNDLIISLEAGQTPFETDTLNRGEAASEYLVWWAYWLTVNPQPKKQEEIVSNLLRVTLPLAFCQSVINGNAAESISRRFVAGEIDLEGYKAALNEQLQLDLAAAREVEVGIRARVQQLRRAELEKDRDYTLRCQAAGIKP